MGALIVAAVIVLILSQSSDKTATVTFVDQVFHTSCADAQQNGGVYPGSPVTVKGDRGNQIATGSLGNGRDGTGVDSSGKTVATCTLTAMMQVPTNQSTYTFSDNPAVNGVALTKNELVRNGWRAGITTGINATGNTGTGGTGNTGTGGTGNIGTGTTGGTGNIGTGTTGNTGTGTTGSTGNTGNTGTGNTGNTG